MLFILTLSVSTLAIVACSGGGRGTTPIHIRPGDGGGTDVGQKLKQDREKLLANPWCRTQIVNEKQIHARFVYLENGEIQAKYFESKDDGSAGDLIDEAAFRWEFKGSALQITDKEGAKSFELEFTLAGGVERMYQYSLEKDGRKETSKSSIKPPIKSPIEFLACP